MPESLLFRIYLEHIMSVLFCFVLLCYIFYSFPGNGMAEKDEFMTFLNAVRKHVFYNIN